MVPGPERDREISGLGLPIILVVLSLFVLMALETTVQEAIKLRQQLELLAGKTAQLAAEGDEGAKTVVDRMKRQGVTLNPPKQ